MNQTEIEARIIRVVAEHLLVPEAKCKPEASFVKDLEADSVELIELAMRFEQEFAIKIEDPELYKVRTIQDAVRLVAKKLHE